MDSVDSGGSAWGGVGGSENKGLDAEARWFAAVTRPHHEKAAAQSLEKAGWETFLPLYRSRRVWSDRIKELDLPLFSGYVFTRFAWQSRVRVLRFPGIHSIVSFGRRPAPIPEEEMAAVRRMVASGLPVEPWPFLRVGQRVRLERGPLEGLEGILIQVKRGWRVVVSVELLRRSVAAEVDRMWVAPVNQGSGSSLATVNRASCPRSH